MAPLALLSTLSVALLAPPAMMRPAKNRVAMMRQPGVAMMAGFGGGGGAKKGGAKAAKKTGAKDRGKSAGKDKTAALSPKRQWDVFTKMMSDGASKFEVYARVSGEEKWYDCGSVSVADTADAQAATFMHKRLVLEHAVRLNPVLTPKARELELGYSLDGKHVVVSTKDDKKVQAGYFGKPDPPSGYYVKFSAASERSSSASQEAGAQAADSRGVLD